MYIEAIEVDPPPFPDVHLDDLFINRTLEVNTNYTRTERYNGTTIFMNRTIVDVRFRVMCQQDYYGADCTTFCKDQNDDVNGHYTCNSDGSIQCRDSFKNPRNNCTEGEHACMICNSEMKLQLLLIDYIVMMTAALTACDSSPCANGGSCTPMPEPLNFTCQCVVGYTGRTCEGNIDDCESATCPNNSMCEDGIDTFECICMPEFEETVDNNNDCVPRPIQTNTGPHKGQC